MKTCRDFDIAPCFGCCFLKGWSKCDIHSFLKEDIRNSYNIRKTILNYIICYSHPNCRDAFYRFKTSLEIYSPNNIDLLNKFSLLK